MNPKIVFGALLGANILVLSAPALAIPKYSVLDLGDLGDPGDPLSHGYDINNAGQVVGYSRLGGSTYAVEWQNGVLTNLGTFGGLDGAGFGINDKGEIVGAYTKTRTLDAAWQAVLWEAGTITALADLGGGWSQAYAINTTGQIVGMSRTANGQNQATLWENGTPINLGGDWGGGSAGYSSPFDINSLGQIAGQSGFGATVWQSGAAVDLAWPGGSNATAYAINDKGEIVGATSNDAVLWQSGLLTVLPNFGFQNSQALGINSSGQIVGFAQSTAATGFLGTYRVDAVLWDHGSIFDLNSFLPPDIEAILTMAQDINDSGQILANGCYEKTGICHAFLLTPVAASVPEPSSFLLFLAGFFGLSIRRRAPHGRKSLSPG